MRQSFLKRVPTSCKGLVFGLLFGLAAGPAFAEYDECDARFIAFLGSDTYQFSPRLPDELGKVRLYSVLSYQKAAAGLDYWVINEHNH